MSFQSRLMRFLGKDNPSESQSRNVILLIFGSVMLSGGLLGDERSSADAVIGAVAVVLALIWHLWLHRSAKRTLRYLAAAAVGVFLAELAMVGLDRLGLSWLSMVFTIPVFILGVYFVFRDAFDWFSAHRS